MSAIKDAFIYTTQTLEVVLDLGTIYFSVIDGWLLLVRVTMGADIQ